MTRPLPERTMEFSMRTLLAGDLMQSESVPSDRRTAIDVGALREALEDEELNSACRWVPGPQQVADALTKSHPNPALLALMEQGTWSLKESEEVRKVREEQRDRKKSAARAAKSATR